MKVTHHKGLFADRYFDVRATRYAHLSAGAILLYDHATTLDQEISLIWQGPRSIGKYLFLVNRYYAVLATMFDFYGLFSAPDTISVSYTFYRWQACSSIVVIILAQAILQLRVYALYTKNKRVLCTMGILFILSISLATIVMGSILSRLKVLSIPVPLLGRFCQIDTHRSSESYAFWIPAIAFDNFLSALAIYKSFRLRKSFAKPVFHQTGEKMVEIFFRDSAIYFCLITATYVTCMVMWVVVPQHTEVPLGFAFAFPCVVSNRMVLNLRGIRQRSEAQNTINATPMNYAGTSPSFGFEIPRQEDTYLSG
ncbi:hypothetical protein CPC08DRAFT_374568 [Agrocybe pediades]|nr:hypothetical protein CPC08DRAFT_374568 [Agrocybe pediades]